MTKLLLFVAALAFLHPCQSLQSNYFRQMSDSCISSHKYTTDAIVFSKSQDQGINQFHLLASSQVDSLHDATINSSVSNFVSGGQQQVTQGLSPEANVAIFIIGIIPFLWATYEFWSRIAVGASFGTGADSIQIRPSTRTIGRDGEPLKSRGQQVLGDGALAVAYALFGIAIGSVSIAIYSVISSPAPPVS